MTCNTKPTTSPVCINTCMCVMKPTTMRSNTSHIYIYSIYNAVDLDFIYRPMVLLTPFKEKGVTFVISNFISDDESF